MGDASLDRFMREHFGFTAFRPGQVEIIDAVLAGRDALGVLPTGGGKSLCYQLPALLFKGLTVVVSPLIALMRDQVDAFNRRGRARAVELHSNLSAGETAAALRSLQDREATLLYVAPERLESADFRSRLLALQPRLLVIDEAHCVSMWGHDFRPSYLCLGEVAASLRPCPVLALTATATPVTRQDILARLNLRDPLVHVAPCDRANLHWEVHPCGPGEKPRRLRRILKDLSGFGSQIVYVGRRKDAGEIAASLDREGFGAVAYHAGMGAADRRAAQEAWLTGETPIAVATIAFGMGIDKADVRAVIHYQHPASLESYYQEAGRAGRDGQPARCIVLASGKDSSLAHFFIRNRYPTREQVLALARAVSPAGTSAEDLKSAGSADMTEEQRNVALLALLEEKFVWRDGRGNYRCASGDPGGRRLSLDRIYLRKDGDYRRLEAMVAYAKDRTCLRSALVRYFGEELPAGYRCGNCSACEGGTEGVAHAAATDEVARVFKQYWDLFARSGLLNKTAVARFLGGSPSKWLPAAWHALPEFGALAHLPLRLLRELAAQALETCGPAGSGSSSLPPPPAGGEPALSAGEVFWRSPKRVFTRAELESRKVARDRGLLVLDLLAENPRGFAPSRIVSVLRGGAPGADARTPELQVLPQWNRLASVAYDELLADVLAMWAKGYISPAQGQAKRLVLMEKGRGVIKGRPV